ncbi:TIGR03086 family metal-binding protein [Cryptosporangium phraense]|uniref:TIGR03086 family protein n=1 Tax=Cryptosporangium phraense TaxID=2593070 RepID=A0A545AWC7_9ACTN|nr:TIGR03086 family metal-binding protein [Cryptosporangium phraense]TQS45581.1 TIGR03086 family protein [Cryptosporangium phraense]
MHTLVSAAVGPTAEIIAAIGDEQLDAPTPCREYDVHALLEHLSYWRPSLVGAARKQLVEPGSSDATLDELVDAWSEPDAWAGTTRMGGPMEMPASLVGEMVLGELVVHGWDVARATGQPVTWDDAVLKVVHQGLGATAKQGREMDLYGPEVLVAADAPLLDRILGLTGRDPRWPA